MPHAFLETPVSVKSQPRMFGSEINNLDIGEPDERCCSDVPLRFLQNFGGGVTSVKDIFTGIVC
jgi:hypothetical protein